MLLQFMANLKEFCDAYPSIFQSSLRCVYACEYHTGDIKGLNKDTLFEKLNWTNSKSVLESNTVSNTTFKNPFKKLSNIRF